MELAETRETVRQVLRSEYPTLAGIPLEAHTHLLSTGRLDSFALVTLIASLEDALGIDIDVEELDIDQFEPPPGNRHPGHGPGAVMNPAQPYSRRVSPNERLYLALGPPEERVDIQLVLDSDDALDPPCRLMIPVDRRTSFPGSGGA